MKIGFSILFFCFVLFGRSQHIDTLSHTETHPKTDTLSDPIIELFQYNANFTKRSSVLIDTSITHFQDYEPHMPLSHNAITLGYFAAPSLSLTSIQEFSSHFYQNPYLHRLFTNNSSVFCVARKPFTLITYSSGSFDEQQVSFFHTQNYSKDLNAGLRIRYYKSQGEYSAQAVSGRHISPWVSYTGDMYSFHALYSYNLIAHDENGGLIRDSLIDYPLSMIMNLSQAKSEKNFQEGLFIQKWNLGKRPLIPDTSRSALPVYKTAFGHAVSFKKSQFVYTDNKVSSLFYPQIFIDSLQTSDTTKHVDIRNTVFFETLQGAHKNTSVHVGVGHAYSSDVFFDALYQYPQTYWNSFFYEGELIQKNILGFNFEHNHTLYLYGVTASDYEINNELSKNFIFAQKHPMALSVKYDISQNQPFGALSQYQSNHASWNVERTPIFRQQVQGKLISQTGNIDVSASLLQINNLMYVNENLDLLQLQSRTFLTQISLRKQTKLWHLYFDNRITYQRIESHAVSLPEYVSYNAVYITARFLRNLIQTNIGFDGLWFSEFYTASYKPSLGIFAYQNSEVVGGYPIVNAFVSIKYKPVRILLKYNGLYTAIMGKNFIIPHYPQQSSVFSFAVSWHFFN